MPGALPDKTTSPGKAALAATPDSAPTGLSLPCASPDKTTSPAKVPSEALATTLVEVMASSGEAPFETSATALVEAVASPAKVPAEAATTALVKLMASPAKAASEASVIAPVQVVRILPSGIVTLCDLSKTELNGKRAEAQQWLTEKCRWQCRLIESDEVLNFRPRNIVPEECHASQVDISSQDFEGQCVVLQGIIAKPELNGERAEVVEWIEEKGRWVCQLIRRDEQVNLKPANLTWDRVEAEMLEVKRRRLS